MFLLVSYARDDLVRNAKTVALITVHICLENLFLGAVFHRWYDTNIHLWNIKTLDLVCQGKYLGPDRPLSQRILRSWRAFQAGRCAGINPALWSSNPPSGEAHPASAHPPDLMALMPPRSGGPCQKQKFPQTSAHVQAAVDVEGGAGDEIPAIGRQKHYRFC